MDLKGCVFDIQRFSVHDGPGIRTNIFLKGCPLQCLWCCNPESQHSKPELMYNPDKCIGCGKCISLCLENAIQEKAGMILFDHSRCVNCGACVEECYAEARIMKGKYMSVDEVVSEIEKDVSFYKNSGGGITFSGGEPLMQAEFVKQVLMKCRQYGIHTAMETCGYAPWRNLEIVAPFVDVFLYDIKHMDSEKHKEFTGSGNEQILENCRRLVAMGKKVIIRVPVVPTFNADEQSIVNIAQFAKQIGVSEINLLPYHRYAAGKYKLLMREYWYPGVDKAEKKLVEGFRQKALAEGVKIKIGG